MTIYRSIRFKKFGNTRLYRGWLRIRAFSQENDGNLSRGTTGFDYSRVLEQQVAASCTRPLSSLFIDLPELELRGVEDALLVFTAESERWNARVRSYELLPSPRPYLARSRLTR